MSAMQAIAAGIVAKAAHPSPRSVPLSAADATKLKNALINDASGYWYSGLLSLGEAISGVDKKRYSWATVKAYYAAFYLSRAILGYGGIGLWYAGSTPYSWAAKAGDVPSKLKGNSHDSVLKLFDRSQLIPRLNGQHIGIASAIEWLIEQRNLANYKQTRFSDPNPNACLGKVASGSIRKHIEAYACDALGIYFLDADHAILAFPIELAKALSLARKISLEQEERGHLNRLFADSAGPIRAAQQFFAAS